MEPRLSYVIGRLDRILRRRLAAAVEPCGLTLPAYTALSVLRAHGGLSNARLARRSLVTPQSMSEVVATLERKGFIRRWNDPDHARILRAELTDRAWPVLRASDEACLELEAQMQAAMAPADRVTLLAGVTECVAALGAWVDRDAPASAAVGG